MTDRKGYHPKAAYIKDLTVGARVIFDPVFGLDTVVEILPHESLRLPGFLYLETLYTIKLDRRYLDGEVYETTIVRNGSEPVTVWHLEDKPPSRDELAELRSEVDALLPAAA